MQVTSHVHMLHVPCRHVPQTGPAPGATYRHLMKSAEEIRERQQAMCTGQMQDLDEQTKRLQQVRRCSQSAEQLESSSFHPAVILSPWQQVCLVVCIHTEGRNRQKSGVG